MQVPNAVTDIRYGVRVARTMPELSASEFTVGFSRCLRDYMAEHAITITDVAARSGRSVMYVSEHTSGMRDVGTDLVNAVARQAGVDPRTLMLELIGRMVATPQ
jgi:hypothetical protein